MPTTSASAEAPPLTAAIIGAGVSGIVTARALAAVGVEVTILEQRADIGGVWSATRAYPGISTQDDRRSYAFSDAVMESAGDHPRGAEVRAYLDGYLGRSGLHPALRLRSRVERATPQDDGTWTLRIDGPDGASTESFDWLIAANGVFSTPHVPAWPGREVFEAAGGRVVSPSDLGDGAVLAGTRTVVVGWGKTACDVAAAAVGVAASVDVVARRIMWKYPKRLGGMLTFRHAILTRAGERLIFGPFRSPSGRLLIGRLPERMPRMLLWRLLGRSIDRVSGLTALGLRPSTDIRFSNSLVTEGFFEAVADGSVVVRRERSIVRLGAEDGVPVVELSDGTVLPADVVIAATGYEQRMDFLPEDVQGRAAADGALLLHRRVLAVDLPHFALAGWAHSYRSPLTSEVAAVWLAGVLTGATALPTRERQRTGADRYAITPSVAEGARTGRLPGVTMRDMDAQLADLGASLPWSTRLRQIWRPVDPADYESALTGALARMGRATRARALTFIS